MEVSNLMIPKRPDLVEKFLKTYSTNQELREDLICQLLNPGLDPESGKKINPLDMDIKSDLKDNHSIPRDLLEKYFNLLGYTLVDTIDDKELNK